MEPGSSSVSGGRRPGKPTACPHLPAYLFGGLGACGPGPDRVLERASRAPAEKYSGRDTGEDEAGEGRAGVDDQVSDRVLGRVEAVDVQAPHRAAVLERDDQV